jgi:alpha,alpha-trehalose phosphorylase
VELRPGSIALSARADDSAGATAGPHGTGLEVSVRGQRVVVGPETVTVALDAVPAPAPTVFPSMFPTAGVPVVGTLEG